MRRGAAQRGLTLQSHSVGPARRKDAPEQRLMIAVLHDALDCLDRYRFAVTSRDRRLFHEARRWFLAEETAWPYSFECICGVLELDANTIRRRLRYRAVAQRTDRSLNERTPQ